MDMSTREQKGLCVRFPKELSHLSCTAIKNNTSQEQTMHTWHSILLVIYIHTYIIYKNTYIYTCMYKQKVHNETLVVTYLFSVVTLFVSFFPVQLTSASWQQESKEMSSKIFTCRNKSYSKNLNISYPASTLFALFLIDTRSGCLS